MRDPQLFDAVCALIRSVVKLDPSVPIAPESTLVDDLGVDSLDLVSVFLEVQDAFGVVVDEEDLNGIVSVADLVAYVEGRRASQAA
ncbi:acyl carrier protein [Tautonia plasticadhaerens]|uniref:Acyl carrier protein n=1 Tax=Tautonia plasticadhaerens TaxID=2527974 RepID=A0A518H3K7_9BACT|nr:acyl carrier protein [Tautonia plasticadhaerens]QDV35407.1 Meromycolate extension acyl carrier protein [Tautonia plasticadhaerens]